MIFTRLATAALQRPRPGRYSTVVLALLATSSLALPVDAQPLRVGGASADPPVPFATDLPGMDAYKVGGDGVPDFLDNDEPGLDSDVDADELGMAPGESVMAADGPGQPWILKRRDAPAAGRAPGAPAALTPAVAVAVSDTPVSRGRGAAVAHVRLETQAGLRGSAPELVADGATPFQHADGPVDAGRLLFRLGPIKAVPPEPLDLVPPRIPGTSDGGQPAPTLGGAVPDDKGTGAEAVNQEDRTTTPALPARRAGGDDSQDAPKDEAMTPHVVVKEAVKFREGITCDLGKEYLGKTSSVLSACAAILAIAAAPATGGASAAAYLGAFSATGAAVESFVDCGATSGEFTEFHRRAVQQMIKASLSKHNSYTNKREVTKASKRVWQIMENLSISKTKNFELWNPDNDLTKDYYNDVIRGGDIVTDMRDSSLAVYALGVNALILGEQVDLGIQKMMQDCYEPSRKSRDVECAMHAALTGKSVDESLLWIKKTGKKDVEKWINAADNTHYETTLSDTQYSFERPGSRGTIDTWYRHMCTITMTMTSHVAGETVSYQSSMTVGKKPCPSGWMHESEWHYGGIHADGSYKIANDHHLKELSSQTYEGVKAKWDHMVTTFMNDWWDAGGGNSQGLKTLMEEATSFDFGVYAKSPKCCEKLPTHQDMIVNYCRKGGTIDCHVHCKSHSDCKDDKVCQQERVQSCGPTEYAQQFVGQCKNWSEGKRHWGNSDTVGKCALRCSREELCYGFVHEVLVSKTGEGSCLTMREPCIPGGGGTSWIYYKCEVPPKAGMCVAKTESPTRGPTISPISTSPTKSPTTTSPTRCPKRESCRKTRCERGGCNAGERETSSSMCLWGGRQETCCKMVCR